MKKILSLLVSFCFACVLGAQEAAAKVYYPGSSDNHIGSASSPTAGSSLLVSVLYIIFLAGLAYAVYLVWKRKNVPVHTTPGEARILDVTATRPLGNRQFLVTVRYGEKELLLGVGQGFITPLGIEKCMESVGAVRKGAKA